jgi:glycosyltransferase involved in cell wall biosynthesis
MTVDVFIITMRREDAPTSVGRQKVLRTLVQELPGIGCSARWVTVRQQRARVAGLVLGSLRWMGRLLSGNVLPLQSILALQGRVVLPEFLSAGSSDTLPSPIVYIDGIRLAYCGDGIRRKVRGRLVVDFDDLMSRRVGRILRNNEALSFGAFASLMPASVQKVVQRLKPFQRMLLRWEKHLLRRSEMRAAGTADAIVFASSYESKLFQRFLRRFSSPPTAKFLVIGPSALGTSVSPAIIERRSAPDNLRFVFIGSDMLEQNRVAIQALVQLSREGALAFPTYIYGRMTRTYGPTGNAAFCGFAETLAQVYQPGSILLLPRSVRGGIKTKILEAFDHGVPTIGTYAAFEGFDGTYPWCVDEQRLRQLVSDPVALRETYQKAVAAGSEICQQQFSRHRYARVLSDYVHGLDLTGAIAPSINSMTNRSTVVDFPEPAPRHMYTGTAHG